MVFFFYRGGSAFAFISCNTGCWIGLPNHSSFKTEDPVAYFRTESCQHRSEQ